MDLYHQVSGSVGTVASPSINGLDHDPISTPSTSQLLPHPDKTDQLESTQIHSVGDQLCPILEMCTITGNIIGTESRSSFHGTQVGRQSDDSCDGEAFSRIPLNTTIPEIAMVVGHETDAAAHWFLNCDPVLDDIPLGLLETLVERLSSQSGGPLEPPFRDLQIRLFEIEGLLDVNAGTRLLCLGQLLLDRATLVDSASDMERSIECLTRASQVIQGEDTDRLEVLEALTSAHETRFRRYGGIGDINSAIEYLNHMTVIAGHKYSDYQVMIAQLANLFALRYEVSEDLGDVQRAIENYSYALTHFSDGNEHRTNILSNLGTSYIFRFERLGEAGDLSRAIDCKNQAFHLTPEGHQDMPIRFSEMGNLYLHRFQHLGVMEDINRAIDHQTRAVQLTQVGDPDMPSRFSNLGISYMDRFECLGALEDICRAVDCQNRAVQLTPEGHPDMTSCLNNLGSCYLSRFECSGDLEDLSRAIDCQTYGIRLTPQGHPSTRIYFHNLGGSYLRRFERLGELEDIHQAIRLQTQAAQLCPEGHPAMPIHLSYLGGAYMRRYERLGELEDISRAIQFQVQAVQLTPEQHPNMVHQFSNLGSSYSHRFMHLGDLGDLNKAIDCQIWATLHIPEGHPDMPSVLNNLGNSYLCRFERLGELEDISRAIDCQTQAAQRTPEGHPGMPSWLNNLGNLYLRRYQRLGEKDDIHKSITYQTRAVQITPEEHPNMPGHLSNLGSSFEHRFERLGELDDLDKGIDCLVQAVQYTPEGHADNFFLFNNLGNLHLRRFQRIGELVDIGKAVDYLTLVVALTSDERSFKPDILLNFGNTLRMRFEAKKDPVDLESAIESYTQASNLLSQNHVLFPIVQHALGRSYLARLTLFKEPQDVAKALECFAASARAPCGSPTVKFQASKCWASLLTPLDRSSSLLAHHEAMRLLPEVIWLGTTSTRRYECITEVGAVAVGAAAAAISTREYDLALEWLEEGRSIVWNQTLQLRTPFDALSSFDSVLAQQLQQVSRDLECASQRTSCAAMTVSDPVVLEQATLQHHCLVHQYERLVRQARATPGFDHIFLPKKVADLIQVARSGPVVVINVHATHCDALIIVPQLNHISHVPLPDLSQAGVVRLHNLLLNSLKAKGIRQRTMARFDELHGGHFKDVLAALWRKLVKPVLHSLGFTRKPPGEQLPHITWCTTGALSLLPIHAAGDYDSGDDRIFHFAITTYTPTLSALLSSTSQSFDTSSGILAVSQESTPGFSKLPGTKHELAHIKERIKGLPYVQLEDSQATPQAVLEAMEKHDCVHLACHASQNSNDPTQSCFHLHGGTLSLEQIARRSLKNKRLAFLSACQTAKGDQKMPDEAIHLAAGMLVAGYSSVIATMWSINDNDAPLVADEVYVRLVRGGKLDCSQAARALHSAVGALRGEVGETASGKTPSTE